MVPVLVASSAARFVDCFPHKAMLSSPLTSILPFPSLTLSYLVTWATLIFLPR